MNEGFTIFLFLTLHVWLQGRGVLCVPTHHVGVERRSDSFVVEVIPVDWREEGVVLYF